MPDWLTVLLKNGDDDEFEIEMEWLVLPSKEMDSYVQQQGFLSKTTLQKILFFILLRREVITVKLV